MSRKNEDSQDLLTPDLALFESQLRSLPVADSKLNRDELLYQAGWSAAVAAQDSRSGGTSSLLAWKVSTAAIATLAALLLVMLVQQSYFTAQGKPGLANNTPQETNNATRPDTASAGSNPAVDRLVPDSSASLTPSSNNQQWQPTLFLTNNARRWRTNSDPTHLTARSNVRLLDWATTPALENNQQPVSKTKTSVELLQEMIPLEKRRTYERPFWQLLSGSWGESI